MYPSTANTKDTQTIPPSLFDATPMTNLDDTNQDEKNRYDVDNTEGGKNNIELKSVSSSKTPTNSSVTLDTYTSGILLFVLVVFAFHPNA